MAGEIGHAALNNRRSHSRCDLRFFPWSTTGYSANEKGESDNPNNETLEIDEC